MCVRWSEIPTNPSPRTLRQFAVTLMLFAGAIACWQIFVGDDGITVAATATLGGALALAGLAYPRLLRPLFVGWMYLVFPVAWVVTHAILALLFFGVFTPLALVFRVCGRDVLALRRPETNGSSDSYWKPKTAAPNVHAYFRQS